MGLLPVLLCVMFPDFFHLLCPRFLTYLTVTFQSPWFLFSPCLFCVGFSAPFFSPVVCGVSVLTFLAYISHRTCPSSLTCICSSLHHTPWAPYASRRATSFSFSFFTISPPLLPSSASMHCSRSSAIERNLPSVIVSLLCFYLHTWLQLFFLLHLLQHRPIC